MRLLTAIPKVNDDILELGPNSKWHPPLTSHYTFNLTWTIRQEGFHRAELCYGAQQADIEDAYSSRHVVPSHCALACVLLADILQISE